MLIFNWANDPVVRQNSHSIEPIEISSHYKWFKKKLSEKNCRFFIVELSGEPVGQVRFDINDRVATINYSIGQQFRGQGLGKELLRLAMQSLQSEQSNSQLIFKAEVKVSNPASIKVFQKLGFIQSRTWEDHGTKCVEFSFSP